MKFNLQACLLSVYWFLAAGFCTLMASRAYGRADFPIAGMNGIFSLFLLYGAIRLLLREKPYTWKRERPFWLFMTKEERRNDSRGV